MKNYYFRNLVVLLFLMSTNSIMAQNDGYLIEENCDTGGSETVCSRSYSTNALDAVKTKKATPINDINEVSVSEHIRQIEEANNKSKIPLPYSNEVEKEQYVKTLYYEKIRTRLKSSTSESNEKKHAGQNKAIRVNVVFKTELSPNIWDMSNHPLYKLPPEEAEVIIKNNAETILNTLEPEEYSDVRVSDHTNIMILVLTESALTKLYNDPNILQITPITKLTSLD